MCSSWTGALVRVDEVDAGAPILTWLRLALVDLLGAVDAVVTRDTLAEQQIRGVRELDMKGNSQMWQRSMSHFLGTRLPHSCSLPGSRCRRLHSGRDWASTRPLAPGSSSQCSRPGTCSSECCPHPGTGRSFCRGEPRPPLKKKSRRKENWGKLIIIEYRIPVF